MGASKVLAPISSMSTRSKGLHVHGHFVPSAALAEVSLVVLRKSDGGMGSSVGWKGLVGKHVGPSLIPSAHSQKSQGRWCVLVMSHW